MPVNRKLRNFINYFLGPIVILWVGYSTYTHIIRQPNREAAWASIRSSLRGDGPLLLGATLLLMLVNWGIESRKWQLLVRQLEPISFRKAYFSVLTGVSISINTPNRIGEYGGRILYLQPENRLKAISLNMVTSVSQLIVTMVMGILGVCYLLANLSRGALDKHGLTPFWLDVLIYGGTAFCALTVVLYFRLSWLVRILEAIPALRKVKPYIAVLDHYEWPLLASMLLLSTIRFVVFVTQYILVFRLFSVDVTWWQGFWAVSVLMLILAVIPTITLTEPLIRQGVAITLLGLFNNNSMGVGFASFVIWIINLIIPALLGGLLILGIKIIKD
ncbi:MAG TPA: lysylphosphatidylglycerol synthase transmembrane domain-containing protein [Dinghuibacter sp.]|uniref:lysylphosphatidylglycerol synthase transmembrane domain-containing protein n=1 Tax=Dinghuibacter sp. TaxID=2024697 RepID=UPI002D05DA93|nr:lysylphosphatidylglycerol synthase transmembrane domain-containing protein [Dinghuibacter sp.]HTJ13507.1 lysylphosphatidylglycerol synthase transmembrane domain-containing protein [Dinghuibacter sp.]